MYKAIDGDVNGTQVFMITEGDYKGVTFCFGAIRMVPPVGGWGEDREPEYVTFEFDVTGGPDHLNKEEVEASEEFQTLAGDVLFDYLQKAFDDGNYKIGSMDDESTEVEVQSGS